MLSTAPSAKRDESDGPAGFVVLAPGGSIAHANAAAAMWLAELRGRTRGERLPPAVSAVASRARTVVDGDAARARVRTRSGRWLLVRASTLGNDDDAPTAVIIEPAAPHELASLVADAHRLTARERAVTQLVAQGLRTSAIADRLHLSPWTVQDHLKAIFEKVGVTTRGELVARLFFEHHAPRLTDDTRALSDAP